MNKVSKQLTCLGLFGIVVSLIGLDVLPNPISTVAHIAGLVIVGVSLYLLLGFPLPKIPHG